MKIAQGMSKIFDFCNARKEKGRQKQESQNPPAKNHMQRFLGGHGLDEQSGRLPSFGVNFSRRL